MSIDLVDSTRMALSLALDAAGLRQQAIAANIANAGAPGYTRLRVSFEEQLQSLMPMVAGPENTARAALSQVRARLVPESAPGAGLDQDIVALNRNAIWYHSLLHGLSRRYAVINTAINEGRRS